MNTPRIITGRRYPERTGKDTDAPSPPTSETNRVKNNRDPLIIARKVGDEPKKKKERKKPGPKSKPQPMTREAFVRDMTVLPAQISAGARQMLATHGWRFQGGTVKYNPLLCEMIPVPKWRKRTTSQPDKIFLVDKVGTPKAMIIYRPTGRNPEVRLDLIEEIE